MIRLLISLLYMLCRPLRIQSKLRIFGLEHVYKALEMGKGAIMVCGHTGDWEGSANAFSAYAQNQHIFCDYVRKTPRQPKLESIVFSSARRHGINIIPHNKYSLKKVLRSLKQNRLVVFVVDQNPKPSEAKTTVRFLGQHYPTYASLEKLATRTGAPVIVTYCYRRGLFKKHHIVFCPVSQTGTEDTLAQKCMNILENYILCYPSQWIWSYRWKTDD